MLRIFFVILAVLTSALALLLEQWELFILAGALLLVAIVLAFIYLRNRGKKEQDTYIRPSATGPEEDLKDLGIIEIRPKGSTPRAASADDDGPHRHGAVPSDDADPAQRAGMRRPEPDEPTSIARQKKDLVETNLQSLLETVAAHTVCLLRRDEEGHKYVIEAIVSKNSYARSHGRFAARAPLLAPHTSDLSVTLLRVGEKGLPAHQLGYYLEPISVRQIAIVNIPLPADGESYVLLADTMEEGGLSTSKKHSYLKQFAGLIASLLHAEEETASEAAGAERAEAPRPRREIIGEEMENARLRDQPLALALVHLRRAEALADEGMSAVAEAEKALELRLRDSLPGGRVERFGELTFGVFLYGEIDEVEQWALDLQHDLENETSLLEGGVSIGVAVMNDRHDTPDALRSDATTALRESYDSGVPAVVA